MTSLDFPALPEGTNDAAAIIETMRQLHGVELMPIHPSEDGQTAKVLVMPKGMEAVSTKKFLDELRDKPKRREGTATLGNLDSFIAHTNRFKDDGSTIFAQRREDAPSLTSILDYHPAGSSNSDARFGRHRGIWKLP